MKFLKINKITIAVKYLEIDDPVQVIADVGRLGFSVEKMNIFCYKGAEKQINSLLKTITLDIDIEEDNFSCYTGHDAEEVLKAQKNHKSIFSFNLFSYSKKRNFNLNAFNQSCIGIETSLGYVVVAHQIRLDLSKFILLAVGIVTFFLAKKLSDNPAFYYLCGVFLGVFASVLVLIYLASKLIPKKPLMYGAFLSGWALVAWFTRFFYDNIYQIVVVYQKYVLIYVVAMSCLSFGVCYYMGPPKSKRSKNLIMWSLQVGALIAVFLSSDYFEAVIAIMAGCVILYYRPNQLPFPSIFRRIWTRCFPPKPRLLSREEFEEQGRVETAKALKDLQKFVQSPNCKQWKVVMNLSQPTRFASFVEGGEHLTLDETRLHEDTINDFSDEHSDSSDSSYPDESVHVDQSVNIIAKSKLDVLKPKLPINFNKSIRKNVNTSTPTVQSPVIPVSNGTSPRSRRNRSIINYEISDDDE